MRLASAILMLIVTLSASPLLAKPHHAPEANAFVLDPVYARPDGSILTWSGGGIIDPYFPTKALLLAQDSGMDISEAGNRWVEWMLAHQNDNGLFSRYCYVKDQVVYDNCSVADADDAMMAIWIELLYRLAPRSGLPQAWARSAEKAEYQLDSIFDSKSTVFFVSKAMPAGLLMDNIEIYAAYKSIERNALRIGDTKTVQSYHARAEYLKNGIIPTFWDQKTLTYKASTQTRPETSFYPDTVVQMIPMLYKFGTPEMKIPKDAYKKWMKNHRDEWFALIGKNYPWGLLAVLATDQGDMMTANCWVKRSSPFRHSDQWNVLDETAFEVVEAQLKKNGRMNCQPANFPKSVQSLRKKGSSK